MLIRDGSTVQENRIVTTAMDREVGERVREDLNDLLDEEGLGRRRSGGASDRTESCAGLMALHA